METVIYIALYSGKRVDGNTTDELPAVYEFFLRSLHLFLTSRVFLLRLS